MAINRHRIAEVYPIGMFFFERRMVLEAGVAAKSKQYSCFWGNLMSSLRSFGRSVVRPWDSKRGSDSNGEKTTIFTGMHVQ